MLRKTLISMAVSGALYVSSGYALELGELTSQSTIDEPYRGRIQVTDAAGLTPDDITVRLGSESEFRQAGLAPSTVLSQLNFSVVRENGQLAVLVQSQAPLEAQQLQFVLAARWPSGQVVREYQTPINQSALVERAQPEVIQSAQPSSAGSNQVFRQETTAANQMATASELNVRKGNTLWSIAGANRPSSQLTIYQTMMAIQALNKDAFYANNINLLREGAVLRLPTQEQIELFNRATSQQEFERQHAAWMALKNAGRINEVVNQEQLNTQAQSNTQPAPATPTGDQLKLASGQSVLPEADASSNAADVQRITDLESELSATNELLDKETREKQEISDQLSEVNEQLATLERLISLKDQQMAELQRQFTSAQQALQEQKNTVDQLLEADQLRREQAAAQEESVSNKVFGNPIILSISGVVLLLLGLLAGMMIKRSGRKKDKQEKDTSEYDLAPAVTAAAAGAGVATVAAASEPEPELEQSTDNDIEEEDPFAFDFDVDNEAEDAFSGFDESVVSSQVESVSEPEPAEAEENFDEFDIPELDEEVSESETDDFEDALGIEMDELADEDDVSKEDPFAEFEIEDTDSQEEATSENDDFDNESAFDLEDTLGELASDDELDDFDTDIADVELDVDAELDPVEVDDDSEQFSEEESFVSNLLSEGDDDQEDADESSVFDREPDEALAESIDEALAEAQQDEEDFGGMEVPEFGEEEAAAESDESDDEEEIDFFDASGDEVATKLDLARAYMDMGDEEGARVILEDVVASGNESQIAEAQSMMERMFPSE